MKSDQPLVLAGLVQVGVNIIDDLCQEQKTFTANL